MSEEIKIIKLDPTEYGLDENRAKEVEVAFTPAIIERDALLDVYQNLLTLEITPAVCEQAGELRKKLVKIRTNIGRIHQSEKAFYLAGGKFVDAWKNKNIAPIEMMESNLSDIELHYVRIENARISALGEERSQLVAKYTTAIPSGLAMMEQETFDSLLLGIKAGYEAKIKAEKELAEEMERKKEADRIEMARLSAENKRLEAERIRHQQAIAEQVKLAEAEAKAKQDEINRLRSEAIAKEKKELEEAKRIKAEEAKAKRAPDKVKMLKLAEAIDAIQTPAVESEECMEIILNARALLTKVSTYIREKGANL
jgi:hypothetical protein